MIYEIKWITVLVKCNLGTKQSRIHDSNSCVWVDSGSMVIGQGQWPKSDLLSILNIEKRKVKRSDFGFTQFDTVLFS